MATVMPMLQERLDLDQSGLIGCVRRNQWEDQEETPWRILGNRALPALLGERGLVLTPEGPVEAFLLHGHLIEFRGGPRKDYWNQDLFRLWSLFVHFGGEDLAGSIILLNENQGDLQVLHVPVPPDLDPKEEAWEAIREAQAAPPGRISKRGSRAHRMCRYCPVRQRCEAVDIQEGETDDWSASYREEIATARP